MVEMLIPLRLNHPRVKAKKTPNKKSCYRVIKKTENPASESEQFN